MVLLAPVDHVGKPAEAALIPLEAGLLIEQGVGVEDDPHAVEAHFRHKGNILFPQVVLLPAVPEGVQVFLAAQLPDLLADKPAAGPALGVMVLTGAREQDELELVHGQGRGTNHKAFHVFPVGHAVTVEDNLLAILVDKAGALGL